MTALAEAVLEALDDEALAQLANRLRPYLVGCDARALLTPAAAAERLSIHPKTLIRAAASGRVPGARRIGAAWRFDPEVLDLLPPAPTHIREARPTRARRVPADTRAVDAIRGTGSAR